MAQHPIDLFFSEAHPLTAYVSPDFSGTSGSHVVFTLNAPDHFIQDSKTGELHTGFATIVLDSVMGGSVMGVMTEFKPIATVGLSVSHLRRPIAGEKITGEASCDGVYEGLAYVKGELRDGDGEPLAIASGTFMIGTRATSIRDRSGESRI